MVRHAHPPVVIEHIKVLALAFCIDELVQFLIGLDVKLHCTAKLSIIVLILDILQVPVLSITSFIEVCTYISKSLNIDD